MLLTLQETAVLAVLLTVAENESVSPRNTLSGLGAIVTVIAGEGGGGGGEEPPPVPPPQPEKDALSTRVEIDQQKRRSVRTLRGLAFWIERVCETRDIFFAIADQGPAPIWRGTP